MLRNVFISLVSFYVIGFITIISTTVIMRNILHNTYSKGLFFTIAAYIDVYIYIPWSSKYSAV